MTILNKSNEEILAEQPPQNSKFAGLDFGVGIRNMKNGGDPWIESVYICRASFAASYAIVPPRFAAVGDRKTSISIDEIMTKKICGKDRFWDISRAVMVDAVNSIAMFWQDAWVDFTKAK